MKTGLGTSGLGHSKKTVPKLGDMLIAADIISEQELQKAVQMANHSAQPLGRVLTDLKQVSAGTIDAAASLQVLVLEGSLNGATAIRALGRCHRQNVSVEESLRFIGWTAPEPKVDSELGLLLLESELINQAMYDGLVRTANNQQITLGEQFVLQNVLSHSLINAALQSIVLISQDKITRKDAVLILKKVCADGASFWDALGAVGLDSRTVRSGRLTLGEVLTQGGFISEAERIASVEKALAQKQMLGELLVQSGMITIRVLNSALEVQEIARTGALTETEAVEALKTSERSSVSVKEAIHSRISYAEQDLAAGALELLIAAGILKQTDVAIGVGKGQQFGVDPLRGLVILGIIDRTVFEATKAIMPSISSGERSRDQAIMLLNYVDRSRCTIEEAIDSLNHPELAPKQEAAILAISGKFAARTAVENEVSAKPTGESKKDFASLDQAVRQKLAPSFVSRFRRSLFTLLVIFGGLVYFFKQFDPGDLALLFLLLLILDTIRIIVDLDKMRREMYDIRTLDIEGVQQRPGHPKRRKDDVF